MRKKWKLGDLKRRALVESARRMSPEQRLAAYVEHSRLVMEMFRAGVLFRSRPGKGKH